ncbi:MAG: 1-acyl-sn-glycerol-3-phosphate acyltransferase [Flavobacteriia bacterium]|jgi:1-acyl-sn-glycerol-3-phosphate acyltransferase
MGKILLFILKIFGWKIDPKSPEGIKKAVIVVGPHTSNWDFVIGKIAFMNYGLSGKFLIKKELFKGPMGWILKAMGGIPVDRKANNNFTEQAVSYFENNETMFMVFTPEGTRSYNPNWKKGFYYIALKAKVPIYIAYMDYEKKIGGFHSLFQPTGDSDADIQKIKDILKNYKGKFPEKGIR